MSSKAINIPLSSTQYTEMEFLSPKRKYLVVPEETHIFKKFCECNSQPKQIIMGFCLTQ